MSNLTAIVAPTTQQLADYMNAAATVNLYTFAISQTSLPVLQEPPANYSTFLSSFEPAKAHCLNWSSSIFPTMLSFPGMITGAMNDMFNVEGSAIGVALRTLQTDPTNQQAKATLAQCLTAILALVQTPLTTAQGLMVQLNNFSTQISGDATTLGNIATQALSTAGADQATITSINGQLDNLNAKIVGLNHQLTVAEILVGVSVCAIAIGVAVWNLAPGFGALAGAPFMIFGFLGLMGTGLSTVLLDLQINADQASILSLQKQVQALNSDVIALQACNRQFVWLQQANQNAQAALQVVINMWTQLQTELTTVKTELTDVNTDVTAAQYTQALTDLASANAAWSQVSQFAQSLSGVNYQWQDTNGNWHSFADASTPVTANGALVTPLVQAQAA